MSEARPDRFDPRGAITVDLRLGQVRVDASARVLVPLEALSDLCLAAGEDATAELGEALGVAIGRRIASHFGRTAVSTGAVHGAVRAAPFGAVVEHLAGEFALSGLGALRAERWGRALLLVVDGAPTSLGPLADVLLAGVLVGALRLCVGDSVNVVAVGRDGGRARFALLSGETAERVAGELASGKGWLEVAQSLRGGTA